METATLKMDIKCPTCGTDLVVEIPSNSDCSNTSVRSQIKSIGNIKVFRITTDEMKAYLGQQARYYVNGTKLELVPRYIERKTKDGIRSYAAVQIAFSEEVIERNKSINEFFMKIGDDPTNVRLVKEIWIEMIQKYKFDKGEIDSYLNSYKKLEELEDKFGITEKYLEDIKLYTTPRRLITDNKESWITFTARVDKIISNMLENPETDKFEGELEIHQVNMINQGLVEFIVYVHPKSITSGKENVFVRKMLTENPK